MKKENKVYYWMRINENFFQSKELKIIRRMPSGSEIIIVLLKLQLYSLRTNGLLEIDGVLDSPEEELAIILDEDKDIVKMALYALDKFSLIQIIDEDIQILNFSELIGKETASTIRSRKSRANKSLIEQVNSSIVTKKLQCNADATSVQQNCHTEIEIEKEIELDIELEKEIEIKETELKRKRFQKPTQQEIKDYADEIASSVDPEKFWDYYESNGWKVGKNSMKDWKATVRNWEKNNKERKKQNNNKNRFGDNVFAEMLEGNYVE